jgi:hypothetical protein
MITLAKNRGRITQHGMHQEIVKEAVKERVAAFTGLLRFEAAGTVWAAQPSNED